MQILLGIGMRIRFAAESLQERLLEALINVPVRPHLIDHFWCQCHGESFPEIVPVVVLWRISA